MTPQYKKTSRLRKIANATVGPRVPLRGFSTISSPSPAPTGGWTNRRVGLDPLVGLVPGAGDVLTMVATGSTLIDGLRYRVPLLVLLRMIVNMALDSFVGAIPVVGDAFDFVFKANRRNVALLENAIADGDLARNQSKRYFIVTGIVVLLVFIAVIALIVWLIAFSVGKIGWF